MAASSSRPELIVIVGPTASGKSELAMRIAKRYDGEIITADSRTIYRGMDIGTAKPDPKAQAAVKHWGLDLAEPDQKFSAKHFQDYALKAIKNVRGRGKLPILVGGTGLYIDSIIFNYDFASSLERDPTNPRHSLKKGGSNPEIIKGALTIGIDPGKEELKKRIERRVNEIFAAGFLKEAKKLYKQYSSELEVFKAPGYRAAFNHLNNQIDIEPAKKEFVQNDLKLAKKQRTWFKRNKFILWHDDVRAAEHAVNKALNT